jgi:hypothetical protein
MGDDELGGWLWGFFCLFFLRWFFLWSLFIEKLESVPLPWDAGCLMDITLTSGGGGGGSSLLVLFLCQYEFDSVL